MRETKARRWIQNAVFDFNNIVAATDNFSMANKLGQGGFGPVYKGKLKDGKEVAVKRLFSSSGQGIEEFKNEIVLISKLRHRNLIRVIGCCIELEEKILVYVCLPNKSLDTFIFDMKRKAELDWSKQFCIIGVVARGLLYLHRDSCLRIILRDLKASNILLDKKFKPKISDFGLPRLFLIGRKVSARFLQPGNSSNRFLAISYHKILDKTIVWVANRDNPANDTSGVLRIGNEGKLVLVDRAERVLWLSNNMNTSSQSIVAQLLDSGKF
ncbi:G-type lectin S-receptor-like serine/threonine-protein kinase At1g11300 [Rhodamnia argentea]|uniref:G-type lectin S-receptor-like serine/threonine-protein kinase At1g11300 n=1 Tax=Rhodamnia argentea TaxID=178133 RepID=A0A8B8N7S6_9MYRT|nr:G-type lectin S-receptor-like serine/threonine-protein kinase At1g11300 [Rhodamnia argentea]